MKKKILIGFSIIVTLIILCIIWYNIQLKSPSKNSEEKTVEITAGMRTEQILDLLHEQGLIKNVFASKICIKINNIKGLQAGKYTLNTNMKLKEVLKQISSGKIVDTQVKITFLEGKNMRWIAKEIASKTNNTEENVFSLLENGEYIKSLINKYWFLTDEILEEEIYYPLEGYLYPETYYFENESVTVEEIFEVLLDQSDKILSKYRSDIESTGASMHQILTIASIVELESDNMEAREGIARVIYNRLHKKMSLGCDVTTYYGIKVDMGERQLTTEEIKAYNAYNTRGINMSGKLPIGPISSVSEDSIKATIHPANSDYLYFVADKNGKVFFSSTYEEHRNKTQEIKDQGLWYNHE